MTNDNNMKRALSAVAAILLCATLSAQTPKVSILGDSYSTFRGAIPQGYAVFYPLQGNDVKNVGETWWHQFITDAGMQLEVNNSYSGSTICNTGYNREDYSDRAFVSRVNEIGSPDILFIFGGTNDAWAGSPIGEYKYRNISKADLYYFRPALAYLLDELKSLYPKTKIYFLLNTELKEEINESVKTVCLHYGVPVIVLHDIDKQISHPSKEGMKAIASQISDFIENE